MSSANTLSADQLKDLQAAIRDGRCALIDVRERHEHEAGHIPLSVNRPLSQLASWYDALDRGQMVVLYCRTGNRARSCAEALQARGFREVYILEGGYSAWSRSAPARE
jgi:rhodanese-related sulfurtransferase